MINEERNLTFSPEALCAAFEHGLRDRQGVARILAVSPAADGTCTVEYESADGGTEAARFAGKELMDIIARFARHLAIPLARRASKSFFGVDGRLVLQMTIRTETAQATLPKLTYLAAARRRSIA